MLNLENIERKFSIITDSEEWHQFVENFRFANNIYIIGNGGLYPTACHAASDATRLIEKKTVHSLDNMSYITSIANDYGYEEIFVSWFKDILKHNPRIDDVFFVGLSCSGNSKNVINALKYAKSKGHGVALISGQQSKYNDNSFNEVCMGVEFFHTAEILSMLLIYDAIDRCGGRCPTIMEENTRKGHQ